MRLLILGSTFDTVARSVAERITRRHGAESVMHRTLEDLANASWLHRVGAAGVTTSLNFADGTTFAGFAPTIVLNRLEFVPTLLFTRMATGDRDYARTEFYALLLSWLAGLGDIVVNRAAPSGLAGPDLRPWQWIASAAKVGLPPFPGGAATSARRAPAPPGSVPRPDLMPAVDDAALARLGFDRPITRAPPPAGLLQILVLGDRVIGAEASQDLERPCTQLSRAVGAEILLIQLARLVNDTRWRFVSAEARPRTLGQQESIALTDWLEYRA